MCGFEVLPRDDDLKFKITDMLTDLRNVSVQTPATTNSSFL